MKRRNVQLAFIGEGTSGSEDVTAMSEGDEAVEITVTGGTLTVVVPAGTPDESIMEAAARAGGELILENGLRFSFEIEAGAEGAQFTAMRADQRDDEQPDLSSLPDVPGGV